LELRKILADSAPRCRKLISIYRNFSQFFAIFSQFFGSPPISISPPCTKHDLGVLLCAMDLRYSNIFIMIWIKKQVVYVNIKKSNWYFNWCQQNREEKRNAIFFEKMWPPPIIFSYSSKEKNKMAPAIVYPLLRLNVFAAYIMMIPFAESTDRLVTFHFIWLILHPVGFGILLPKPSFNYYGPNWFLWKCLLMILRISGGGNVGVCIAMCGVQGLRPGCFLKVVN
jgi:hypothetical protein